MQPWQLLQQSGYACTKKVQKLGPSRAMSIVSKLLYECCNTGTDSLLTAQLQHVISTAGIFAVVTQSPTQVVCTPATQAIDM